MIILIQPLLFWLMCRIGRNCLQSWAKFMKNYRTVGRLGELDIQTYTHVYADFSDLQLQQRERTAIYKLRVSSFMGLLPPVTEKNIEEYWGLCGNLHPTKIMFPIWIKCVRLSSWSHTLGTTEIMGHGVLPPLHEMTRVAYRELQAQKLGIASVQPYQVCPKHKYCMCLDYFSLLTRKMIELSPLKLNWNSSEKVSIYKPASQLTENL